MSLIDQLLARRSMMFTSPLSVADCRDRIGPTTTGAGPFSSGANGVSPFIVQWRGENEVVLATPWRLGFRKKGPRSTMRARFEAQSEGTFVEVTAGMDPRRILNYALLWLFFGGYALLNLAAVLHSPNAGFGLGFCVLLGPFLYVGARLSNARQAPQLVMSLENTLGTVGSPTR